ncbi:hypothetical protein Ciccas_014064 [Cichlidogyrus casuarinus]|uniref:Uncharacterized protein n=1 Tax=Cichlidogyrus casuarinus TaxID=1844966 RepID=A0ABD2PLY1_9PLAT
MRVITRLNFPITKVHELTNDFCDRYKNALKSKMPSDLMLDDRDSGSTGSAGNSPIHSQFYACGTEEENTVSTLHSRSYQMANLWNGTDHQQPTSSPQAETEFAQKTATIKASLVSAPLSSSSTSSLGSNSPNTNHPVRSPTPHRN